MNIYKITNLINGKIYIGKTIRDINVRFKQHYQQSKIRESYLGRAMIKYGKENFKLELIHKCLSTKEMDKLECHYIEKFNSANPKIGYNVDTAVSNTIKQKQKTIIKRINTRLSNENNRIAKYQGIYYDKYRRHWKYEVRFNNFYKSERNFKTSKEAAIARDFVIVFELPERKNIKKAFMCFPENYELIINNKIKKPNKELKTEIKKSIYNGVSYDKDQKYWYVALILDDKRVIKKGMWDTELDAAIAFDKILIDNLGLDHEKTKRMLNFKDRVNDYLSKDFVFPKTMSEKFRKSKYQNIYKEGNAWRVRITKESDGKRVCISKSGFDTEDAAYEYLVNNKDKLLKELEEKFVNK